MEVLPISAKVTSKLIKHSLQKKFNKQLGLLKSNPRHPGLKIELLEPKQYGIYSFRVDRKYRALFVFRSDKQVLEILAITVHYK